MIETLGAPVRARARRSYWRLRALKGIGYATPVAVMVGVFFVLPLGLVFWMSANRWRLLGSPTFNVPDNYARIPDNQLFLDSIVFTLKYTAIVDRGAVGGGDGARAARAGGAPRHRLPAHGLLPARRGRLRRRRAAVLRLLRPERAARRPPPGDRPRRRAGALARHAERGAVLDDRDGDLALRRASTC